MRLMSTSARGAAKRSFITGMRLMPPASTLASSPTRSSVDSASSSVAGAKYSKFGGYTAASFSATRVGLSARPYASPKTISTSYDAHVPFGSVDEVERALAAAAYLPDRGLATAVYLAVATRRPLLLEGEAGVGKTEVAKTLARVVGACLIRLQCYEGIDAAQALYEWDYARQLLYIRAVQAGEVRERVAELYGPEFLLERPLLRALRAGGDAVLLVDELDRADDEFEAFLLEVLSDFSITIPEIGTIAAEEPPVVVVTSNRTREL